jgi:hypothetical protein
LFGTTDAVVAVVLFAAATGFGATFAFGTEVEVPGTEDEVPGTPTLTAATVLAATAVLAAAAGCTEFPAPSSLSGKRRHVRLSFNFVISRGKVACYKEKAIKLYRNLSINSTKINLNYHSEPTIYTNIIQTKNIY